MKKGVIIGTGLVLLMLGIIFDRQIAFSITNYRTPILTGFMHTVSFIGSALGVIIITSVLFLYDRKKRSYIPVLLLTLISAIAISYILKYLVARPRPNILPLEIKNSFSFPSTHAAAIFAPFLLIDNSFPKLKWLWLALAMLVIVSRVYLGVHYLSDVIAGALLGYIMGIVILRITNNPV